MKLFLTLDNEKGNKIERAMEIKDDFYGVQDIVESMIDSMNTEPTGVESIDGLSGKEEQEALKVINNDF